MKKQNKKFLTIKEQILKNKKARCITRNALCKAFFAPHLCDLTRKTFKCGCLTCVTRQACIDFPFNNSICEVGASSSPAITASSTSRLAKPPKISALQFAYAFHKFIHNERNTEDWNKLDEQAYQAAKTGV